ncbi:hypothetical protein V5799_011868 [Amblyomma americanum]|uniref:Uncharacterized protein n=1 Tax=Amblyomma americanum TaxID=6943 RepID=A0AAQ4EG40_AMBAM
MLSSTTTIREQCNEPGVMTGCLQRNDCAEFLAARFVSCVNLNLRTRPSLCAALKQRRGTTDFDYEHHRATSLRTADAVP